MKFLSNILIKAGLVVEGSTQVATTTGGLIVGGTTDAGFKADIVGTARVQNRLTLTHDIYFPNNNTDGIVITGANVVYPKIIVGSENTVSGNTNLIFGKGNTSTGSGFTFGNSNTANSNTSMIFGIANQANSSGQYTILIGGSNTTSHGIGSYTGTWAIGHNNVLAHQASAIMGSNQTTTANNQLIFASSQSNVNNAGYNDIYFGTGPRSKNTNLLGSNITINGSGAGAGSDLSGGSVTIAGGKGTGAGTPGDVIISTASTTTSGSTLQTLTQRLVVAATTGNVTVVSLAGSGNRMVIVNSSGVLSTQAINAGSVTSITAGTGLSGGTITSSGTIAFDTAWGDSRYSLSGHTHDDRYYTETEIANFFSGTTAISGYNKSNWDTAYGWGNHASAGYATTSYVTTQINNLIAGAPGLLDTLDELAAALGDDPNFATTITTALSNRLRVDTATQGLTATQQSNGRTNLGLGSAATSSTGDFATAAQGTKADTAHGWGNHASAGYLTSATAASTYLTISNASSTYLSLSAAASNYLTINNASTTYLSLSAAASNYLSINNAATTYLSLTAAASNYVSLSGSYANPSWITSLAWSKITGAPAFLTSYTETDTLATVTSRGNTTTGRINVRSNGNQAGGNIMMGNTGNGNTKWSYLTGTHYNQDTQTQGVSIIGLYSDSAANTVVIGGSIYEANPATEIQFWTHTATTHNLGGSKRMVIDTNGNVGVNINSPLYRVDISGSLRLTGALVLDDTTSNVIQHRSGTDVNTLVTVGHGGFDHNGYLRIGGANVATQSWVQSQGYLTSVSDVWVNTSGDTMTGELVFSMSAPQIRFADTDHYDHWIHVNSNRFYVLSDRNGDGAWETPYPMELNSETNTGYIFGGTVWTSSNLTNLNQLTNGPGYVTGGPYIPVSANTNATGWISFSASTQGTPIIKAIQQDTSAGYYLFQGVTGSTEVYRVDRSGGAYFASAVGIGTASPSYTLHVSGTGYFNSTLYVNGQTTLDDQVNITSGYSVNFGSSRLHSTDTSYFLGGNVGIGVVPTYLFHVSGGSGYIARFDKNAPAADGGVAYFVNASATGYSSYIYIGSSPGTDWKVGKNILNPASASYPFEIVDSSNNLAVRIQPGGAVNMPSTLTVGSSVTALRFLGAQGSVGSPNGSDLPSSTIFSWYNGNNNHLSGIESGGMWHSSDTQFRWYYKSGTSSTARMTLDASNGNLTITGTLTEQSAARYKENIAPVTAALEKVDQLQPVSYNKKGSSTKEIGLIAEDVFDVYPEFVLCDDNGEPVGVHYSRLTAVLIESVKELKKEINELKSKN